MVGSGAVKSFLSFLSPSYWRESLGFSFGTEGLFILLALVFILVWGLSMGRTKSIISLLSVYVAYGIARIFPYTDALSQKTSVASYWIDTAVFLVSLVVVFVIFTMSFLRKRLSSGEYNLIGVMMITVLQLGLIFAVVASFLPAELIQLKLGVLGPWIYGQAVFYWFIAPLGGLLFINYFLKG